MGSSFFHLGPMDEETEGRLTFSGTTQESH